MNNKVHAEIEYVNPSGSMKAPIHPIDCDSKNLTSKGYRDLLHCCLDEWLDNSNGSGCFYIKNSKYVIENIIDPFENNE
jgi:hypothetical protein